MMILLLIIRYVEKSDNVHVQELSKFSILWNNENTQS